MSSTNNQPDDSISNIKADIAVLKSEIEHIKQRDRWVQGILGALIVAVLIWFGQNTVGFTQRANPIGASTSQTK
jgi:hypothetical protein